MAVDQDAVEMFQPQLDELLKRIEQVELQIANLPSGSAVDDTFIAFQDALWTALSGKTDSERIELLKILTETAS